MKWSYQEISHHSFTEDSIFDWSSGVPVATLHQSILQQGILIPFVVHAMGDQTFRLVDGFKRFYILKKQQQDSSFLYPCLVIPQEMPLSEIAFWRIETWPSHRKNTGIEVLTILSILQKLEIQEGAIIEKYLPKLGLKPSQKVFRDVLKLINMLEGVEQHTLTTYTTEELLPLLKFSSSEIHGIVHAWKSLKKMGGNKWKSILQLLHEVCRFQNCSLTKILDTSEIQEILHNSELQAPVRFRLLKQQLESWRYPELTSSRRDFEHGLQKLVLPKQAKVQYDPFFEKDTLLLTVEVASAEELEEQLTRLQQNWKTDIWKDLFRIVHGE
ncbi:MAG: hypothetical protein HQM14_17230 [SAR324 cluster bacterium]|nr:hypothetical protein [SAR324 cluster bacterium]